MNTVLIHLTSSRFFGGPERQMLELGKSLPPEIHSVFISFSERGLCRAFIEKARQDGFEAIALRHDTPRLLAALRELVDILRRLRGDGKGDKSNLCEAPEGPFRQIGPVPFSAVLCCHGYKAGLLGLLAARRIGIPVISVSRGWTGENFKVRLYDALDRRVLRWMDKVVCVSEGQAAKVRRAGVREEKITVIRNAVRSDRFDNPDPAARDELLRMFSTEGSEVGDRGSANRSQRTVVSGQCSDEGKKWDRANLCAALEGPFRQIGPVPFSTLIVGAAGRLSPEKGFDVLIDAAARVSSGEWRAASDAQSPKTQDLRPIRFVLFGDGPLRESLARRIAAKGFDGRFIMAGFRSDLDRLLPHLDLLVLPSHSEGLPNVALEAQAAGVPVVATAVGGTPEVIEDGQTGFLVPPGDPAALAERIGRLLIDPALRARFAAAGRERVAARFSFAAQAEDYRNLLASLTFVKKPAMRKTVEPTGVCFVIDNLGIAGTESQLLSLMGGLDRAKVRPHLCLLDGQSELSSSLEPADCPVMRLGVRSLRRPSTLVKAWRFARFLRRNRVDVVHCFFPDSTRFAVPVARLAGVRRVVASRRNLGYWMTGWDRLLARLYHRWIDVTVANCEACRRAVIEQEGIAPDRVVVIPNGIDLERFAHIPSYEPSLNCQPEGGKGDRSNLCAASEGPFRQIGPIPFSALRRVGMVANLRPVKGPDIFIRAAALVVKSHPNTVFQIAGQGDMDSARRLARECGIEDRLELLGQVRDIPAFLAGLDVAVLASRSEGLSNALLEYMAAGRPIVATDVGGNSELIEDGVTGFLVPPQDPAAMARRICDLLADPITASNMSLGAKSRGDKLDSYKTIFRRYCDLYLDKPQGQPNAA
jgi:glycosyltransferase involved in cell wall biosynthesis